MKIKLFFVAALAVLVSTMSLPGLAAEPGEKLAAISKVLDLYLANKLAQGEEDALAKTDDYSKEPNAASDPAVMILDMLAGNTTVGAQEIALATEKKPELWALASVALFVRKVAMEKKLDSFVLENFLQNYLTSVASSNSPEVTKWKPKVEQWAKWLEGEFAPIPGLDPLLAKKSKIVETKETALSEDLEEITPEAFTANREASFTGRPKPPGLEFDQKKLKKYLESLPQEGLQQAESKRQKYIDEIKELLIRIFERNPYTGVIKFQNGSTINATIAMANEDSVIIRSGNAKGQAHKWKELHVETFVAVCNSYAEQRLKVTVVNVSEAERKRHAARDFLHIAVLCDWYGRYEDSLKYAVKAIKTSPEIKPEAVKIMLGK